MPEPSGVTVVIPAYNPGPRLRTALASVSGQAGLEVPVEVIVVDDGGAEDLSYVDRLDPGRIRRVRQPNAGVSVARNVGVRAARHPLVAFLDQDDEWQPDKLARQLAAYAERPEASFHSTGFDWVSDHGEHPSDPRPPSLTGLLSDGHVCLSSVLVRADWYWDVGGHDPILRMMQDFDLFLRLMLVHGPAVHVSERLVRYHVHDENASRDYRTAAAERLRILGAHELLARHRGDAAVVMAVAAGRARTRELYAHQAIDAARGAARADAAAAVGHLEAAVRFSPSVVARAAMATGRRRVAGLRRGGRS